MKTDAEERCFTNADGRMKYETGDDEGKNRQVFHGYQLDPLRRMNLKVCCL